MPIHLAPLTRRRFLTRTLAAGAALALAPECFAASRRTDPDSWALLSDIHLAADRTHVARGINMTEHFEAVSRELTALDKCPAGVFITGDCAFNSGQPSDYAVVSDLLKPLRAADMPIHIALGNHDNRERFWASLQEEQAAKRPLADRHMTLLSTPRVNWFVLDSLEKTLSTPGLLGQEQLDWLAGALDANRRKPAIVMAHHNPTFVGSVSGLKDTDALFEILRPRKQVKAFIFGHTHAWNVKQDTSGIHLVNLPPVAYIFKDGDPAGWVHATVEKKGMRVELRCLDTTHKAHGEAVQLSWRV
jgi:3',5'-cyclic-AMP phosphodiesterase